MNILTLSNVTKSFGSHKVIDGLSFCVPSNCVFGFIGQNGAGKTTTMKMILGLLSPDCGEIRVNNIPVTFGGNHTSQYIGYLPDVPEFYNFLTPKEYLTLCGQIKGMPASEIKKRSKELLELVGLENTSKKILGFSRGMKQRLGIAQALMGRPKLLICDEPTSALDPVGRKEILDILLSVKEYSTVLFSTHILSDVERICDHVAFLNQGKIVLEGSTSDIRKARGGDTLEIEFLREADLQLAAKRYPDGKEEPGFKLLLPGRTQEDMREIMADLMACNIPVRKIELQEPTLENLFMEVVRR